MRTLGPDVVYEAKPVPSPSFGLWPLLLKNLIHFKLFSLGTFEYPSRATTLRGLSCLTLAKLDLWPLTGNISPFLGFQVLVLPVKAILAQMTSSLVKM